MNSKKAMELSINFLVILIISTIVLIFGLKFLYDIYEAGKNVEDQMRKETRDMIKDMMRSGGKLSVLCDSQLDMKALRRGEVDHCGIGVLNIDAGPYFQLGVQGAIAKYLNETVQPTNIIGDRQSYLYSKKPIVINNKDDLIVPMTVKIPEDAPSGTYALNVYVCDLGSINVPSECNDSSSNLYWPHTEKIYLSVK